MSEENKQSQADAQIEEPNETEDVQNAQEQEAHSNEEPQEDPLAQAQAEAQEYKDKYLRAYADFENTKKRLEREKADAVAYANERFAKDLLAVLDSFEAALQAMEGTQEENGELFEKMKEGVALTYNQLKKVLEKYDIKEIACEGEFDPQVHQAIQQVESQEHESGHIVQVLQKGYMMKDRVLRPALVSTNK